MREHSEGEAAMKNRMVGVLTAVGLAAAAATFGPEAADVVQASEVESVGETAQSNQIQTDQAAGSETAGAAEQDVQTQADQAAGEETASVAEQGIQTQTEQAVEPQTSVETKQDTQTSIDQTAEGSDDQKSVVEDETVSDDNAADETDTAQTEQATPKSNETAPAQTETNAESVGAQTAGQTVPNETESSGLQEEALAGAGETQSTAAAELDKAIKEQTAAEQEKATKEKEYQEKTQNEETAQKVLKSAEELVKSAVEKVGQIFSAKDFFIWLEGKDSAAVKVYDQNEYKDAMTLGADKDSTSLTNLRDAIAYIKKGNEDRAKEKASSDKREDALSVSGKALKVTSRLMAMAQCNADENLSFYGHTKQFQTGENIVWGTETPASAYNEWYDMEKAVYWKAKNAGTKIDEEATGHYTNLVSDDYTVTGLAIAQRKDSSQKYATAIVQTFDQVVDDEKTYTPDEYLAKIDEYISSVRSEEALQNYQKQSDSLTAAADKYYDARYSYAQISQDLKQTLEKQYGEGTIFRLYRTDSKGQETISVLYKTTKDGKYTGEEYTVEGEQADAYLQSAQNCFDAGDALVDQQNFYNDTKEAVNTPGASNYKKAQDALVKAQQEESAASSALQTAKEGLEKAAEVVEKAAEKVKAAQEVVEKEKADQEAAEKAAKEEAEKAAREAAEKAAREEAEKTAREAAEKAAQEAAEKAKADQAARETAEKAQAEKEASEAAARAVQEAAERAASEAAARNAAAKAAQEAAAKAARTLKISKTSITYRTKKSLKIVGQAGKVKAVKVNGHKLKKNTYTVSKSGKTITLKGTYVYRLKVKSYTVTAEYKSGKVKKMTGKFKVVRKTTKKPVKKTVR